MRSRRWPTRCARSTSTSSAARWSSARRRSPRRSCSRFRFVSLHSPVASFDPVTWRYMSRRSITLLVLIDPRAGTPAWRQAGRVEARPPTGRRLAALGRLRRRRSRRRQLGSLPHGRHLSLRYVECEYSSTPVPKHEDNYKISECLVFSCCVVCRIRIRSRSIEPSGIRILWSRSELGYSRSSLWERTLTRQEVHRIRFTSNPIQSSGL